MDKAFYDWMNEVTSSQRRILNYMRVLYDQQLEVKATCDAILNNVMSGMTEADKENLKNQLKEVIERLKKSNPSPSL